MGVPVRITISGRVGPLLRGALCNLDIEVVPRHDVVVLGSVGMSDLLELIGLMERHGVEIDRITGSGPRQETSGAA